MSTTLSADQRRATRSDLSWPVSVWLPEANRFFNGRSVNVSKGGVFMTLPVTAPVEMGHEIEVNFPRTKTLAKQKGKFARIKTGKIVRVDRKSILENAQIEVAVRFNE